MKFLFYAFLLIGMYHLIYEGILLPSLRLRLRFRLFEIRDRLRTLKHLDARCCSDQAFNFLQDSINNGLGMLHRTDLIMLFKVEQQIESSELLRNRLEKRNSVLSEVFDPDIIEIRKDINHVARYAVLLNSGGWFIYIIPAMITVLAFGKIKGLVKELLMFPEDRFAEGCRAN